MAPTSAAGSGALALGAVTAVTADLAFHDGLGGVGVVLLTVVVAAGLVSSRTVVSRQALACLGAAVVLSGFWLVRESPWIRIPTGCCAGACLVAGVWTRPGDSLFDVPWLGTLRRAAVVAGQVVLAPVWLVRGVAQGLPRGGRPVLRPMLRGLLIAVPLLGVLIWLLASADPLFASILRFNVNPAAVTVHVLLLGFGALVAGTLARTANREAEAGAGTTGRHRLGRTEVVLVLGAVASLLAVFVATQVAASFGVGRHSLALRGISYASYARSGYFQLLWVVAITSVVVTVLDAVSTGDDLKPVPAVRALSLAIVVLTLAVEVTALRRLALYDQAFGLTMLRVACVVGAVGMTAFLVLVGVWVAGGGRRRRWLPGAAAVALVATVIGFAAMDPERTVATYDLGHARTTHLDVRYLASLSDDAVPTLVAAIPTLPAVEAGLLRQQLCARPRPRSGWAQESVSSASASRALRSVCLGSALAGVGAGQLLGISSKDPILDVTGKVSECKIAGCRGPR